MHVPFDRPMRGTAGSGGIGCWLLLLLLIQLVTHMQLAPHVLQGLPFSANVAPVAAAAHAACLPTLSNLPSPWLPPPACYGGQHCRPY
jgi:hypothetical protein